MEEILTLVNHSTKNLQTRKMKSADSTGTSKLSCIIKNAMTTGIELIWYELTSGKIWSVVKRPFPPPHSPSLTQHTNPHIHTPLQKQWFCLTMRSNRMTSSVWRWETSLQTWSRCVNNMSIESTMIMWNTMFHTTSTSTSICTVQSSSFPGPYEKSTACVHCLSVQAVDTRPFSPLSAVTFSVVSNQYISLYCRPRFSCVPCGLVKNWFTRKTRASWPTPIVGFNLLSLVSECNLLSRGIWLVQWHVNIQFIIY